MTLYHGSENIIEAPEFGKGAQGTTTMEKSFIAQRILNLQENGPVPKIKVDM